MSLTATLTSPEEYLATAYRPDCDFIEGELIERNVGQKDHSNLQGELWGWFRTRRQTLQLKAFVEQRIQISLSRYRVPDICVVRLPEPDEQIFTSPPYIVIEILSPEDPLIRLQQRFDDYLSMGVPNIWVLDPDSRRGWAATDSGLLEARSGLLQTADGTLTLPISNLFED